MDKNTLKTELEIKQEQTQEKLIERVEESIAKSYVSFHGIINSKTYTAINVREHPNSNANILGTMTDKTPVIITNETDKYYEIEPKGYVLKEFIKG